jgi:hypothetical protein
MLRHSPNLLLELMRLRDGCKYISDGRIHNNNCDNCCRIVAAAHALHTHPTCACACLPPARTAYTFSSASPLN